MRANSRSIAGLLRAVGSRTCKRPQGDTIAPLDVLELASQHSRNPCLRLPNGRANLGLRHSLGQE